MCGSPRCAPAGKGRPGGAHTRSASRARRQPRSDTQKPPRARRHTASGLPPRPHTRASANTCPPSRQPCSGRQRIPAGRRAGGRQVRRVCAPGEGEGPAGPERPRPRCEPPPPHRPRSPVHVPPLDTPFANISTRTPELHALPHTGLWGYTHAFTLARHHTYLHMPDAHVWLQFASLGECPDSHSPRSKPLRIVHTCVSALWSTRNEQERTPSDQEPECPSLALLMMGTGALGPSRTRYTLDHTGSHFIPGI